jgi:hypothetical protein
VLANTWTTLYHLVVNIINVQTEIVTQGQKVTNWAVLCKAYTHLR